MWARTVKFRVNMNGTECKGKKLYSPYFEEFYGGLEVRDSLFGSALLVFLDGEQMEFYIGSYFASRRKAV